MPPLTRRDFLAKSAFTTAAAIGAPQIARAEHPASLRVAMIGVGGRANAHYQPLKNNGCQIVAMCDVDEAKYRTVKLKSLEDKTPAEVYPDAKFYKDYRDLLARPDQFDAVVISTPDHSHYYPAMAAMKAGKAVFCEKPLTWSFEEATKLAEFARKNQIVTQMGNQGMSSNGWRVAFGFVEDGAIGELQEVTAWRGHDLKNRHHYIMGDNLPAESDPIPADLDWDLWLGPAPKQDFRKDLFHPRRWRSWQDYGSGLIGDWGCHIFNALYKIYGLKYPTEIECLERDGFNDHSWASASRLRFRFPAGEKYPGFDLNYYDGKHRPPRPAELDADRELRPAGILFRGSKGSLIVSGGHNNSAYLIPNTRNQEHGKPKHIPAPSMGHMKEFLQAAKGQIAWDAPLSNFMYASRLSQFAQLGNVATRLKTKLAFDPESLQFKNNPSANQYLVGRKPRAGFEI